MIERDSWQDRYLAVLLLAFAILALTLAAVGLYAALSYSVSLHLREIVEFGWLWGASATSVQGMLMRQGLTLAAGRTGDRDAVGSPGADEAVAIAALRNISRKIR